MSRIVDEKALEPTPGLVQKYINDKMDKKNFKPQNMKGFDSSKWGGEAPIPIPKKKVPVKIKPMKFKINKKGVLSKKK